MLAPCSDNYNVLVPVIFAGSNSDVVLFLICHACNKSLKVV